MSLFPSFLRAYPPAQPAAGRAYWLPFRKGDLLVQTSAEGIALFSSEAMPFPALTGQEPLYFGILESVPCLTYEVDATITVTGEWRALGLRSLYGQLDAVAYEVVGYATQLLYWQRTSHFCPVCGHSTEAANGTWGRQCPNCGHVAYPHVSPAILALIHDGQSRVLLTHKPGWGKRFSCVAGFVEPGESLEECAQREILEEVGVEVTDVTYVGSQPWPFPHQVMVGFTARYVRGEIQLDRQELDDARWFSIDALPDMPPPLSLAHYIITSWVASKRG